MLSKESKIRVLENFYAIDYALLGKPVSKAAECCPLIAEEYISTKGALISVVIEMFKLINHKPKALTEMVAIKDLRKMARESAKLARKNCQKLVKSEKARANIKEELQKVISTEKKVDIDQVVQTKIREKAFTLVLDNLLIARTITESENYKELNSFSGQIIEDAYKILRDSLVESALSISDDSN